MRKLHIGKDAANLLGKREWTWTEDTTKAYVKGPLGIPTFYPRPPWWKVPLYWLRILKRPAPKRNSISVEAHRPTDV